MQTFLPYASFVRSAAALDDKRLGKQRVETYQIMMVLSGASKGWGNHPMTRMWAGYECALMRYQVRTVEEWLSRPKLDGGRRADTCLEKTWAVHRAGSCPFGDCDPAYGIVPLRNYAPRWLGDRAFHTSHQSNLIRKLPERYGPMFPGVPDDLPYVWPV